MSDAGLSAQVVELIREVGKLAPTVLVGPESRFVEDLGIDSLDLVAVFLAVQDRLGVEIHDDDVTSLKSVADLVTYVAPRYSTRAA